MKKNILLLLLLLCTCLNVVKAQIDDIPYNGVPSNVTVFAKEGDKFWLILNGEKQNEKPAANVKITGLTAYNYKVKVIFEDAKIPSVDANMIARDVDNRAVNVVYEVRKKAGKSTAMVMRVASYELVPGQGASSTASSTTTKPTQPKSDDHSGHTSDSHTTTTTTTDHFEMPAMPQVSMSVKVPDMNGTGGISVTQQGNGQTIEFNSGNVGTNATVKTTTTTKTTTNGVTKKSTTSSTSSPNKNSNISPPRPMAPGTSVAQPATERPAAAPAPAGCKMPMSATAFQTQLSAIKKQSFSDTKKKTARTAISKNCLSTEQVKTILKDFSFEGDKVEIAKFAYPYTVDKENYLSVTELFSFSSSTEELTEFLDGQ